MSDDIRRMRYADPRGFSSLLMVSDGGAAEDVGERVKWIGKYLKFLERCCMYAYMC